MPDLAAPSADELAKALAKAAKAIYKAKGIAPGALNAGLREKFSEILTRAVNEGFGFNGTIDYTTPDGQMLEKLHRDVWHFSSAKNYQQLKAMSAELVGPDGKLRSFRDFREAITPISDKFVNQWLQTEYNLAVAGGQMASKWVDIERTGDTLPLIRYETAGDPHVRDSHAAVDGVTRRWDDTFWNTWFPPNGFNCRCTIRQLPSGKETPVNQLPANDDVPPLFRTNLGKAGLVFPPGHAYYDRTPPAAYSDKDKAVVDQYHNQKWIDSIRSKHPEFAHLADEELTAVNLYTGDDYQKLNEALRLGQVTPAQRSISNVLNSALSKLPDVNTPMVYRGASLEAHEVNVYKVEARKGGVITWKAFSSTSTNSNTAAAFADGTGEPVLFIVKPPRGGKDIMALSKVKPEEEALFKSEQQLRVKGYETREINGEQFHVIELEPL